MLIKRRTYKSVLLFLLILVCSGFSMTDTGHDRKKQLIDKIIENIPSKWRLVERKLGVIPYGHYWGSEHEGPKGFSLILEGDEDVYLHWKDNNGLWHQEALAKESLELWIMPPDYSESWKRYFIIHRPKSAELLFPGKSARIYGYPGHRIVSDERFTQIILHAKSTKWPESPANKSALSWGTWKEDIRGILKGEF